MAPSTTAARAGSAGASARPSASTTSGRALLPYRPAEKVLAPSHRGTPAADEVVGELFSQLRGALGLSTEQLARLLATTPAAIVALEAGEIRRLPGWAETERIVRAYTGLAGIDPGAMLERMRASMNAATGTPVGSQRSTAARSATAVVAARPASETSPRRQRAGSALRRRPLLALPLTIPLASMARRRAAITSAVGIVAAAFLAVGPLAAALPAPMQRAIGAVLGRWAPEIKTMPDGMPLIDPLDPRSRRGDKLQSTRR